MMISKKKKLNTYSTFFSDFYYGEHYNHNTEMRKATNDFARWKNENPDIKILLVCKRAREIDNAGNGIEHYDIDVIYEADRERFLKDNKGNIIKYW